MPRVCATASHFMICAICGKPATCVGVYDPAHEDQDPAPACDSCCGHGNETGWCTPIEDWKNNPVLRLAHGEMEVVPNWLRQCFRIERDE